MPASLLTLNDDVLTILVSYLDPPDARRLSLVARRIHLIATNRALQSVTLACFGNVVKFCTYMLNRKRHRLVALREFRMHCLVPPLEDAGKRSWAREVVVERSALLVNLLQEATRLRVFVMHSAEHLMEYNPRLVDVVSSLRHLTEIELQVVGPFASKCFNELQSTPRKLVFTLPRRREYQQALHDGDKLQLDPKLRLSTVKYLVATDTPNVPELAALARAFPGTRSLDISLKDQNLARGQPIPTVEWPTLERVRGPGSSFAHWRNSTRIHLFEMVCESRALAAGGRRSYVTSYSLQMFSTRTSILAAIANVHPVALAMPLDSRSTLGSNSFWTRLLESSGRLRYLAVALSDIRSYETCGDDLAKWWANVHLAIATSGVICLEIRCSLRQAEADTEEDVEAGNSKTSVNEDAPSFDKSIYDTFSASVRDAAPALQYLSLDMSPRDDLPSRCDFLDPQESRDVGISSDLRWWCFQGSPRSVKPLDAARGEQIAAYLRSTRYDYEKSFRECDVPF